MAKQKQTHFPNQNVINIPDAFHESVFVGQVGEVCVFCVL